MISRRSFLAASIAAVISSQLLGQASAQKTNVVLIIIDDLGVSDLHCTSSKWYETPNIDAMSANGLQFNRAYAACAVCSPTRAAIYTGKYPARLHITDWIPGEGDNNKANKLLVPTILTALPLKEKTIATTFKDAGYKTGFIGKWHLGGKGSLPTDHGWDYQLAAGEMGHPASYFWPYGVAGNSHRVPDLAEAGGKEGEYLSDRLTDESIKYIESNKDAPFFLTLSHYTVHTPLQAKKEYVDYFKNKPTIDDQNNPVYAAMIKSMDESIGRIRAKLRELGIEKNTLLIFTSDNGGLWKTSTSNRPYRAGKAYAYEGGLRIPLIIEWPGKIAPGTTTQAAVCSYDIFNTLTDLCHLSTSSNDGQSFADVLKDGKPFPDRTLYWHYPHYWNGRAVEPYGVILSKGWKLIEFYEDNQIELYDLSTDPKESKNLAETKPEMVKTLLDQFHDWRTRIGAQMPTLNPAVAQ